MQVDAKVAALGVEGAPQARGRVNDGEGGRFEETVGCVSAAIRTFAVAFGTHAGSDCYMHAACGQRLMKDLGFETRLVAGYAAWRIGPGDGDVLGHAPSLNNYIETGRKGFVYHAWLEYRETIFDLSTYQFRLKAQQLDRFDGGRTTVMWCPDYLLLPRDRVLSLRSVRQGERAGLAYYEERPEFEHILRDGFTLDKGDFMRLRLILANPGITVHRR